MSKRTLKLGAILAGVGTTHADWRDPALAGDASIDIQWYITQARKAEAAKFDLVFIVDSPYITPDTAPHFLNRLEPLTLLSALAVSTSHIGLVATLTTSFWEPYNVARQFGSLDLISGGRAGWNVVTTGLEGAARNYGREEHFAHADRYARAGEFVDVVQGLWDSYEDDAFPRDKASGVFLDKTKQHRLDHKGEYFSVAGPLALTRSPQGQPVIFQAGDSSEGRNLGARIAEGTFAAAPDFETALAYTTDIKARAAALGRNPDHLIVMPGLSVFIADSDAEAKAREDERIIATARAGNLTLRETANKIVGKRSPFVGTATAIADEIERWFTAGAVDGFQLHVSRPADFDRFLNEVVPILQQRGQFRTEYEGTTLRSHLGLPVPENRYTAQGRQHDAIAAE